MSKAFELLKTVLHAEEVVRKLKLSVEVPKEKKNDIYLTEEVPLTTKHDCHSVVFPDHVESINHFRLELVTSAYKYRINHGEWIDVAANEEVAEKDFNIESFDVNNDVGTGTLDIYFEGIRKSDCGV